MTRCIVHFQHALPNLSQSLACISLYLKKKNDKRGKHNTDRQIGELQQVGPARHLSSFQESSQGATT